MYNCNIVSLHLNSYPPGSYPARHATQIKVGLAVFGLFIVNGLVIGLIGLGGYTSIGHTTSLLMIGCGFGSSGTGLTLVGLVIGYLMRTRPTTLTDNQSDISPPPHNDNKEIPAHLSDKELRDMLIKEWIDPLPEEERPVGIILSGGSGVGKSTLRNRITQLSARKFVVLDSDVIKERMPDYQRLLQKGNSDAATLLHDRSAEIRRELMLIAFRNRKCVIIDSTGADENFWLYIMEQMKENNYEIGLIRIEVSLDIAWKRCQQRAHIGRSIPESTMRRFHNDSAASFPALQKPADWWAVYDNTTSFKLKSSSSQQSEILTLLHGHYS